MRRLVALQRDLHNTEGDTTSQSDWSDEDDIDPGINSFFYFVQQFQNNRKYFNYLHDTTKNNKNLFEN